MAKIPITPHGHRSLKEKLKHLKKVERPKNIKDIEIARSHGDLSENAEYHAAKERQAMIVAQIAEIERNLAEAEVIDPSRLKLDRIAFGATVKMLDADTEEEKTYTIVGSVEADVSRGYISIDSPIARSLLGKEEGDAITVTTPRGAREFEILEIAYMEIEF